MAKKESTRKQVAQNRKARFDFAIEDTMEAGIVLQGSEVKSLRTGKANITDTYAEIKGGEVFLVNSYIPEYKQASHFSHYPRRPRKLLLHTKQIRKLIGKLKEKGYTLVPLSIYFNERNIAKVELALGKGKKRYDKRETIKQREWNRNKARILKGEH